MYKGENAKISAVGKPGSLTRKLGSLTGFVV
jgi:hypothetical protein